MSFVLLVFSAGFFFGGCASPLSPPDEPMTGSNVLVVRIGDGAPASRTALPSALTYTISVSRPGEGEPLGTFPEANASASSFPVPLRAAPEEGDIVLVEGFDSGGNLCATGSCSLTTDNISGTLVSITLYPSSSLTEGTGDVNLSVGFPSFTEGDAITAAEMTLYRGIEDYRVGSAYAPSKRYRIGDTYGAGEALTDSSIPIRFDSLPSGNYVVQIEFFRFKFVRVSRLVQTIIV
ncbi:MAG: hypothetical protein LBU28_02325, partial [Spirochaetaceae bacterium]|nr:hypothetical protein [Spirochaetaceae bacterium]